MNSLLNTPSAILGSNIWEMWYCCFNIEWHENRMQISVGPKFILPENVSTVIFAINNSSLHIRWSACLINNEVKSLIMHPLHFSVHRETNRVLADRYRPCIRSVTSQTKTTGTAEIENVELFVWILILQTSNIPGGFGGGRWYSTSTLSTRSILSSFRFGWARSREVSPYSGHAKLSITRAVPVFRVYYSKWRH